MGIYGIEKSVTVGMRVTEGSADVTNTVGLMGIVGATDVPAVRITGKEVGIVRDGGHSGNVWAYQL